MNRSIRGWWGMLRSRAVYDWKPGNRSRMVRFYRQFIQPGDLCFDLGAHVGNRTRSWRDLGARVISIEPQPRCLNILNNRFGRDEHVVIVPKAVASTARELTFHINPGSPTISTLRDRSWQEMMAGYSHRNERWDEQIQVQTITLDDLVDQYGQPAFCKIDVEGFELEVLKGLHRPLPHLSLEFFSKDLEPLHDIILYLNQLGRYEYNFSLREQHRFELPEYTSADRLMTELSRTRTRVISGDIYARHSL